MAFTVIVVGGGRIGAAIGAQLTDDQHRVTVVEHRPARAGEVRELVPEASVITGDGSDPAVLEAAGIHGADVVAAVTGDDATNVVVAGIARSAFAVPRVIARIVDPARSWLFTPEMGVDVPLDQARLIAHLVAEELSLGEMTTLAKLRRGRFSLVEERVHTSAPAAGRPVAELGLPEDCVLAAVIRGDRVLAVHGHLVLEPDDEVLAVVHTDAVGALHALLRADGAPDAARSGPPGPPREDGGV